MARKLNKKTATAMAGVTAASLLVSGSFASPEELLADVPDQAELLMSDVLADDGDDGAAEEYEAGKKLKGSVRRGIYAVPKPLRAVLLLPLWCIGAGLTAVAEALWAPVLSPVLMKVLVWLLAGALALALFCLGVKTLFPDMPLKKIVNRRSVAAVLMLTLLLFALDALLPFFWDGYEKAARLVRFFGLCLTAGIPTVFFALRERRKRLAAAANEVLNPEEEQLRRERTLIKELADSVCK